MLRQRFHTARCIRQSALVALLVAGVAAAPASARPTTTLTFSEPELLDPVVHGLHYRGLTFGFTVGGEPSPDIRYRGYGPRYPDYALEGASGGTLTLTFDRPTRVLDFEVAQNSFTGPLSPGATIELFKPNGRSRGSSSVDTSLTFASYSYEGKGVGRAVITFNTASTRFAIDNLTYNIYRQ
jgi:hypothetical protein